MEKVMALRSLCRATCSRSSRFAVTSRHHLHHHLPSSRSFLTQSSLSVATLPKLFPSGSPFAMGIGSARSFSEDIAHLPAINDPEILSAFKNLMASNWDDIPSSVIKSAKHALSKSTDDNAGQEALKNVLRADEAVEEFGGMIMNLKMELDDFIGMSGEGVKPLPDEYDNALHTILARYTAYIDSFGPNEFFLRKKVETELGSKMIYLKMRCRVHGPEWGKVTVLGTSGLGGSFVEQRA